MHTLSAFVANCLISGDEVTRHPDGSWIRDVVRFNCGGREFTFRQRPDVAQGKIEPLKGTFCKTSTVEVENVTPIQRASVLATLDAICWLLSFATQSRIVCYGHEFSNGPENGCFKSVTGIANHFRPPLDPKDTSAIKSFIEQAYPAYQRLCKRRKLPFVFDNLVQAERPSQPTEIRLVLLFVTLENLKDTFAREKGIPYLKGFYRKLHRKPGKPGATLSFEELLLQTLRSVGMRRGLKQVVALRNEIIHSGLSRNPPARQWQMYERIQDIVREYIFRLLGYRGEFFTYASQGTATRKV